MSIEYIRLYFDAEHFHAIGFDEPELFDISQLVLDGINLIFPYDRFTTLELEVDVAPVPILGASLLLGSGLLGLAVLRKRSRASD